MSTTPTRISELPSFKKYEEVSPSRVYLDVLVRPTKSGWLGICNELRFAVNKNEGPLKAAQGAAEKAFTEYFDRNVSWMEIKLERETDWELVASVSNVKAMQ